MGYSQNKANSYKVYEILGVKDIELKGKAWRWRKFNSKFNLVSMEIFWRIKF